MFHVLPEDSRPLNYGKTVFAGEDMSDRREILARLAGLYLVIEAGTGREHEARVATSGSRSIIPVGRSGGHGAVLFEAIKKLLDLLKKEDLDGTTLPTGNPTFSSSAVSWYLRSTR